MARPSILRADTLDLQDQENPSAAEHHKHPQSNGNAPHVQAQVQHVIEERLSEDQSLQEAWNIADNLAQEPSAIDQAQANNIDTNGQDHVTDNAAAHVGEDDGEGADGEVDADDDMMDRISSSPSIDDGGYSLRASALSQVQARTQGWPRRLSSLSPAPSTPTPTRDSFNQIADSTPESSPFVNTPQHLPLRSRVGWWNRSLLQHVDDSPSDRRVFDEQHSESFRLSRKLILPSTRHHQNMGRYDQEDEPGQYESTLLRNSESSCSNRNQDLVTPHELDPVTEIAGVASDDEAPVCGNRSPITSPFRQHSFLRHSDRGRRQGLVQSSSLSSMTSEEFHSVLLPIDDPLLDVPASPTSSAGSWESMPDSLSDGGTDRDWNDDDDDDDDDIFLNLDPRFVASGWEGDCLHEAEDIDFEFVYALHTFVATVEGQANATKGDTMVLLDDSNSYWWLVRVVKDSSIGYLPAEHIETPTERLARLNKHRNIDLSATMLSDNSEKSRNPLKKAMRRRNAKTVQFAAPTYVEASDYDYSTDDEDNVIDPPYGNTTQAEEPRKEEAEAEAEKAKKTEIEHPEAERRSSTGSNRASFDREQAATAAQALAEAGVAGDSAKMAVSTEAAPLKSKRTRNTDSFLKDDKIDTVRITLTPGLLRDENAKSPSLDTTRSSSFDEVQKKSSPVDTTTKKDGKDKKKEEKQKKGGMLSGLFKSKKKDRKSKDDSTDSSAERPSTELQHESPRDSPVPSGSASPIDKNPQSSPTGLQSGIRNAISQVNSNTDSRTSQTAAQSFVAELEGSAVAHEMSSPRDDPHNAKRLDTEAVQQVPTSERTGGISNTLSPIANMLKPGDKEGKPKKAKKAKQRVELDDFDSPDGDDSRDPFADETSGEDRLSESPVEISSHTFMHGTESIHIPTVGEDTAHEETADDDEPESISTPPSIIEHPAEPMEDDGELVEDNDLTPTARSPQPIGNAEKPVTTPPRRETDASSSTSSSRLSPKPPSTISQQSWNDDSFKAWLDDGSEVRDMLVMIHDKTGIKPVSADHPLMSDLFVQQRKGVQNMMSQLDGLLGSYLQRKGVQF